MKKANTVFGILGLLLCAYVWISSAEFPTDAIMKIGPDFFPRVMATAMGVASVALLIQTYVVGVKGEGTAKAISLKDPGIRRAIVVFILGVIYAALLEPVGFIISTIIFMMIMMYVLEFRSCVKMLAVSVLTVAAVIFAFQIMLQIQLPAGVLDGMLPW